MEDLVQEINDLKQFIRELTEAVQSQSDKIVLLENLISINIRNNSSNGLNANVSVSVKKQNDIAYKLTQQPVPQHTLNEWIKTIDVPVDQVEELLDQEQTASDILLNVIKVQQHKCPIICFNPIVKSSLLYTVQSKTNPIWITLESKDIINVITMVQKQILKSLNIWKTKGNSDVYMLMVIKASELVLQTTIIPKLRTGLLEICGV